MGNTIPKEDVISNVVKRCKTLGYTFSGFHTEYTTISRTKVQLTCNIHNVSWNTTTASSFLRGIKGCPCCQKKNTSKANGKHWIGEVRKTDRYTHTIERKEGGYLYVSCSTCSKDKEMYPALFRVGKSDWAAGKCPCGCSKSFRRDAQQFSLACERKAATLDDVTFVGFKENGKVKVSSNIILSCPHHGEWDTSTVEKFLSKGSRGCPSCAKEGNTFGLYKNKLHEEDNIYLLGFINMDDPTDNFVKIGRAFDIVERVKKFPKRYSIRLISILCYKHSQNYEIEQTLHRVFKEYRYSPKIPFGGSVRECYDSSILYNPLLRQTFGLQDGKQTLYDR